MTQDARLQNVAEKLLEYAENGRTFQTDKIVTVPSSAYTDESQWNAEMEKIFRSVPLCVASTAELREANAYKAMEVIGLPILITRGQDGIARAFLNVCSHRGAPIAENGCGAKKRFACKYHGWTYTNTGELMGVAEQETFGEVDKSKLNLTELPCQEKGGLIFASLTPDTSMDLEGFMDGMLDDLESPAIDFANWTYLGSREIEGANWKIAFDGYLEGYHFAQLHPETTCGLVSHKPTSKKNSPPPLKNNGVTWKTTVLISFALCFRTFLYLWPPRSRNSHNCSQDQLLIKTEPY